MTAQFFANIACLIAVATAIVVCRFCECNRKQWSERRD